jgi:hypothetical protein
MLSLTDNQEPINSNDIIFTQQMLQMLSMVLAGDDRMLSCTTGTGKNQYKYAGVN